MENKNQTMQETLNEMHAAIDRFKIAFTTLVESIEKPAGSTAALTEEMKKEIITDVCDNISEVRIREEVVEKLVEDFDTSDIESQVIDQVTEKVVDDVDTSSIEDQVVESLSENISQTDIADRVVEQIALDDIADKVAERITKLITNALKAEEVS